ncbi:MAG: hypothetical protein KGL12_05255 [Rhodospirillales bacterium]|nr:hypothetical protein [Rhodospirillales bacterium]
MSDLFAPEGGWRVRLRDLSLPEDDEDSVIEEVAGFATLMQANDFARRYVRDQIERCRAPGLDADAVLAAWRAFGEDAEIVDAGDAAWHSAADVAGFAAGPRARAEERNWRALDPRRIGDEDDSDQEDAS